MGKQPGIRAYGHLSEGPFSESGAFSVDILSGFVTAQIEDRDPLYST